MLKSYRLSAAALLLALAMSAVGQGSKPKPDAMATKYKELSKAFSDANEKYYAPYQAAKSEEEMAKIKLDPAKDPVKEYLPKFIALAKEAGKSETALDAWVMVMNLSGPGDKATMQTALDRLLADHLDSPKMARVAQQVGYAFYSLPPAQRIPKTLAVLTRIENGSKLPDVKASALYAQASLYGQSDPKKAAAIYDQVMAKYPKTTYGERAKGDKFEAANLIPGKPALDFEAEDQDGVKFKLSDYRGKVVVLDFWGFW